MTAVMKGTHMHLVASNRAAGRQRKEATATLKGPGAHQRKSHPYLPLPAPKVTLLEYIFHTALIARKALSYFLIQS